MEVQMHTIPNSLTLLRLHGVKVDNCQDGEPTVVVRACVRHKSQNGCLFTVLREDTSWTFVSNQYVDDVLTAMEADGERILLL
jgi:hypothetical protein